MGKMKKAVKERCIYFIYNCIYADYKKALRKRNQDGMYKMRKEMYEKHLADFQVIINKELKMKMDFVELEGKK